MISRAKRFHIFPRSLIVADRLMEEEEYLFLSASPTYAARQGSMERFTRARGIILSRASFVSNGINSDRNG
jgi:DNA-binding transcriptional LysR family regulator